MLGNHISFFFCKRKVVMCIFKALFGCSNPCMRSPFQVCAHASHKETNRAKVLLLLPHYRPIQVFTYYVVHIRMHMNRMFKAACLTVMIKLLHTLNNRFLSQLVLQSFCILLPLIVSVHFFVLYSFYSTRHLSHNRFISSKCIFFYIYIFYYYCLLFVCILLNPPGYLLLTIS